MRRQTFKPEGARADLPYSPAVRGDGTVYISGHVPVDPQTRQTLENLKATAALAGVSFADVVKVNIFLTDMSEFAEMNKVYREYFPTDPPARTTVGTPALSHPDMKVEIELIALAPEGR